MPTCSICLKECANAAGLKIHVNRAHKVVEAVVAPDVEVKQGDEIKIEVIAHKSVVPEVEAKKEYTVADIVAAKEMLESTEQARKGGFVLMVRGDQAFLTDDSGKPVSKLMPYEKALKTFDRFSTRR